MATAEIERRAILLRSDDNVAVAAAPIPKGAVVAPGYAEIGRGHERPVVDDRREPSALLAPLCATVPLREPAEGP